MLYVLRSCTKGRVKKVGGQVSFYIYEKQFEGGTNMETAIADKRKTNQLLIVEARKRFNQAIKDKRGAEVNRCEAELKRLERQKSFYATGVTPIQFANGFVINGKLLEQFTKRLKGFSLTARFTEENKMIEFTHKNGKITLYDLREYYQGLSLPKAEVVLDDLGININ